MPQNCLHLHKHVVCLRIPVDPPLRGAPVGARVGTQHPCEVAEREVKLNHVGLEDVGNLVEARFEDLDLAGHHHLAAPGDECSVSRQ